MSPLAPRARPIAVTVGEPAGIGPEICLALADRRDAARFVLLADRALLQARAAALGVSVAFVPHAREPAPRREATSRARGRSLRVWDHPLAAACAPGRLDPVNAPAVVASLRAATAGCLAGEFCALVTAPVHKGVINDAGIPFTGHTELLAQEARAPHVVMLLVGGGLRVALATTHLPLARVPQAITPESLEATIRVLEHDLRRRFGLARPRIAVCGLNPHAGEGGHLGREEIEVIAPVIERLRAEGLALAGPVPADTAFVPRHAEGFDCVLAMYHDQGLPVLKRASFGHGVNVTLGLPFVRTSVDHGTALELAGTGQADAGSLLAAADLAIELADRVAAP